MEEILARPPQETELTVWASLFWPSIIFNSLLSRYKCSLTVIFCYSTQTVYFALREKAMKKLQPEYCCRGLQLRKPNKRGSIFFLLITEITKERERRQRIEEMPWLDVNHRQEKKEWWTLNLAKSLSNCSENLTPTERCFGRLHDGTLNNPPLD